MLRWIEALFSLYALALLVQALMEREIRGRMKSEGTAALPLYPEQRPSPWPTATQILRLFAPVQRHRLLSDGRPIKTIHPTLTDTQREVLRLLDVPVSRYRRRTEGS